MADTGPTGESRDETARETLRQRTKSQTALARGLLADVPAEATPTLRASPSDRAPTAPTVAPEPAPQRS